MLREFAAGFALLGRGFGFWRRRPGAMALGLIPAAIAFAVLAAALTALGLALPGIVDWATPFADGWPEWWRALLRISLGVVTLGAAAVLAAVSFTALTLVVGDPFYERIWRHVEAELGSPPTGDGSGFWRTVADAAALLGLGLLAAAATAAAGLLPLVGAALAAVLGVVLTGRLLARELMGRAFDARAIDPARRRELLAASRWRVLGFGVATQLCFLVPLGAVATMPAAVAGATMLARDVLERGEAQRARQ
ncbi:EI24 domain-containing protein [Agromyces mediolanus]|uniref:EI24 domain-containing protein n=1 Tax=Agromyces mediolanus TaxID=41986 RepID=UPI00203D5895|nr:EI24 domain-containing protein [Agromyces mediolanus]MCM3658791.1 EI24 domain-containing protein [Agromyces mediolanus]